MAAAIESRRRGGSGGAPPLRGKDAGDHPPITPTRLGSRAEVSAIGGVEWRLYEYIARHFLGSLAHPLRYSSHSHTVRFADGGEAAEFVHLATSLEDPGFGGAMPWVLHDIGIHQQRARGEGHVVGEAVLSLDAGMELELRHVGMIEEMTQPPPFLQEHELLALMDSHGIGTDASMATHVATVAERNYAVVVDETGQLVRTNVRPPRAGQPRPPRQRGRYLVPTPLGLGVVRALQACPSSRSHATHKAKCSIHLPLARA